MTDAVFDLIDEQGNRVDESELRRDPVRAGALMKDLVRVDGGLEIDDPASGVHASLGDVLPMLMKRFCLDGLERLQRDKRVDIDFYDHEETLSITVTGGEVRFDSTMSGQRAFPADGYFAAMTACGERYTALLASLPAPDDGEAA